jgi:hypothetical protein
LGLLDFRLLQHYPPEAVIKTSKGASGIGQPRPALPPSPSANRLKSLKNNQSPSDAPDGLWRAASYVLAKNVPVLFAAFHAIEAFGRTGENARRALPLRGKT